VEHPSLADVLALHREMMQRLGWSTAPLRAGGEGLLESAILRPQFAAHYEGADVIHQAALLGVGISQARAFVDGNRRTAFHVSATFLLVNRVDVARVDPLELARQLEAVATRTDSLENGTARVEAWLRAALDEQ
jgi:prophage maintenance system killer protein